LTLEPTSQPASNLRRALGAATYTFLYATSLENALRALAGTGLRFVELTAAPPHVQDCRLSSQESRKIRRLAEELNIQLLTLNPTYLDLNLASLNRGIRQETLRQLTAGLQLCYDLQISTLVLFGGRRHVLIPAPLELVETVLLDGLDCLLDKAAALGITIGLENGPTLLLDHGGDVAKVCETVRHPSLGAVFDSANSFMVEDPVEGLQSLLRHLVLVHLSDTTRNVWAHSPIGEGAIDFGRLATTLGAAEYQGPTVLEVIDPANPVGGLERSIRQLAALRWWDIAIPSDLGT
jgi:sugar phosphate isomerase/epimerase